MKWHTGCWGIGSYEKTTLALEFYLMKPIAALAI